MIVYPAKQQGSTRQASDEHECHNWAQGQTGIAPTAPPVAPGQPTQQAQASQTQQAYASEMAAYNERMGTFKKAFGVG